MNIWIINPFDSPPGETDRFGRYRTLATELSERGHKVLWWTSSFSHLTKKPRVRVSSKDQGFEVKFIDTPSYKKNVSLARVRNHRQYAKEFFKVAKGCVASGYYEHPDRLIVSVPPLSTMNVALRLRQEFGSKVIFDVQDAWPEGFYRFIPVPENMKPTLGKLCLYPLYARAQNAYKAADAITGVADTYVNGIAHAQINGIPFHVTPIGFQLGDYDVIAQKITGKDKGTITFVYLGSMSQNYDLETVIYAAERLLQRGFKFRIIMAGSGPNEMKLRQLTKARGLESAVQFKGFLDFQGVVEVLCESDVALNCIVPESYSALPNKVGDYFGAGLAVINSISGELDNLIKENNAGVYYEARNIESLCECMSYYINNPSEASRHGSNARGLAEIMFDRSKTYPEFANFIESA